MSVNTPSEIVRTASEIGLKKARLSFSTLMVFAILAGIYIAMGALLSFLIGYGFPEVSAVNPGLQRLLSGVMFPIGLMLVVLAGAELFTGNNAVMIPAVLNKKISWSDVWKNWGLVYIGNFVGSLFFTVVMVWMTGLLDGEPYRHSIVHMAETKSTLPWGVVFLRGIGANWLVCLAVWLGLSANSTSGKMMGIWFPVMAFVAMGFEHSIANIFYIPMGMLQGADVSCGQFLWNNLIPATIGNIIGGAFFVGTFYWYAYCGPVKGKV